jgi:hypothetical protein
MINKLHTFPRKRKLIRTLLRLTLIEPHMRPHLREERGEYCLYIQPITFHSKLDLARKQIVTVILWL